MVWNAATQAHPIATWHALVEPRDLAGLDALRDDTVAFLSPRAHSPPRGKSITALYLTAVFEVFFRPSFCRARDHRAQ